MPTYVALLRGINLGNRRIKMDRLRAVFEELPVANVETFIASGNVLFESRVKDAAKLEAQIQSHLEKTLGYGVDTFLRTREEMIAVAEFRPFSKADLEAPANTVHVGFLKEGFSRTLGPGLVACKTDVDAFCVNGREYYWLCRIKTNESKVWSSPQVKALKLPSATTRNLTTVKALAALLEARK